MIVPSSVEKKTEPITKASFLEKLSVQLLATTLSFLQRKFEQVFISYRRIFFKKLNGRFIHNFRTFFRRILGNKIGELVGLRHVGKNYCAKIGQNIANFLGLKHPKSYTGHCWRGTAATILAEEGLTTQQIQRSYYKYISFMLYLLLIIF